MVAMWTVCCQRPPAPFDASSRLADASGRQRNPDAFELDGAPSPRGVSTPSPPLTQSRCETSREVFETHPEIGSILMCFPRADAYGDYVTSCNVIGTATVFQRADRIISAAHVFDTWRPGSGNRMYFFHSGPEIGGLLRRIVDIQRLTDALRQLSHGDVLYSEGYCKGHVTECSKLDIAVAALDQPLTHVVPATISQDDSISGAVRSCGYGTGPTCPMAGFGLCQSHGLTAPLRWRGDVLDNVSTRLHSNDSGGPVVAGSDFGIRPLRIFAVNAAVDERQNYFASIFPLREEIARSMRRLHASPREGSSVANCEIPKRLTQFTSGVMLIDRIRPILMVGQAGHTFSSLWPEMRARLDGISTDLQQQWETEKLSITGEIRIWVRDHRACSEETVQLELGLASVLQCESALRNPTSNVSCARVSLPTELVFRPPPTPCPSCPSCSPSPALSPTEDRQNSENIVNELVPLPDASSSIEGNVGIPPGVDGGEQH